MQQEYDDEDVAHHPDFSNLSEEDFAAVFYHIAFACHTLLNCFALQTNLLSKKSVEMYLFLTFF